MADFDWPDDLVPYAGSFYLQPHTGGSESPFSRVPKVYGLSAPRWIASLSFRGGAAGNVWGYTEAGLLGSRIEAFIAQLEGRLNRVRLYDFRRPAMQSIDWVPMASNLSAALGDTEMTITGLTPNTRAVLRGDYLGGDERPHIITADAISDADGEAVVSFKPPLSAAIGAGDAIFGSPTGLFRLTSDDAGANPSTVGELTQYTLDFVEDL